MILVTCLLASCVRGKTDEPGPDKPPAASPSPIPPQAETTAHLPGLDVLRNAYPDVVFSTRKDKAADDWIVTVKVDERTTELYYAEGRFLAVDEIGNKDHYRRLVYPMPDKPADPSEFTPQDISRLRMAGSAETRRNAAVAGTAFFDALYDSSSLKRVEAQMVRLDFLGKRFRMHKRLVPALRAVEARILSLARQHPEIAVFVRSIGTIEGFHWRQIRDTGARSFHSVGIALDILPQKAKNRIIYWNWEKDRVGDNWMLTPLSKRWSPPPQVIRAFSDHGFIWGGNWMVWDNMHFEYRPELLMQQQKQD